MNLGGKESEVAGKDRAPTSIVIFCLVIAVWTMVAPGKAQVRGVYPLGMTATNIHPGQNLNLDYSVTRIFLLNPSLRFQLGLIGYEQWQTTDKTSPTITPAQSAAHYRVNSLGFASNLTLPDRHTSVGFKFFQEFADSATFQGHSFQIIAAISF